MDIRKQTRFYSNQASNIFVYGVQTEKINQILHIYGSYIIGRMGVPYRQRMVSIISIVLDAPNSVISALSGKLGMLPGVQTKTIYSKV